MNELSVCGLLNCDRPVRTGRLCASHYMRFWKYGPSFDRSPIRPRVPAKAFIDQAIRSSVNECIEWPYSKNAGGYGVYRFDGATLATHSVLGLPRPKGKQAAHSCNNPPCVNPRHLRWATPSNNQADRISNGTTDRAREVKLTVVQADEIRSSGRSGVELGRMYGVSSSYANAIKRGEARLWDHS